MVNLYTLVITYKSLGFTLSLKKKTFSASRRFVARFQRRERKKRTTKET